MTKIIVCAAVFLLFIADACRHDAVVPDTPVISFATDISPLITSNCASAGCHDGSRHLFSLIGYDHIVSRVSAGNAFGSKLYTVMATNNSASVMPPKAPLTDDQVRLVYIWIMQGAKNN